MGFITQFFEQNQHLMLFVYGLVFFVMGLAIVLQSRRASRLELARSLTWLAAFGLTHGLTEWADVFIPVQASYTPPPVIQGLRILQLVLLGLSFTFLLQFGVSLLAPQGPIAGRLRVLPVVILSLWVFVSFFLLTALASDALTWYRISNALARYFIGFPGGLLAAYGLRKHAKQRIAPLNVPVIYNTLRIAGISLALYAVFSGLIPPPIPFLPGSLLNTESFTRWLGVPPTAFRSLIGLVLAVAIIRALEIFEVETIRRIEALEQQSIITAERERIARDLHDGAIQKVYTAGLLVEAASSLIEAEHRRGGENAELSTRLSRAKTALNDAITDLRRNLTELNPNSAPGSEPLAARLERLASNPDYTTMVSIQLELKIPADAGLSPVRMGHLLSILNESLSNVVRHAHARHVAIRADNVDGDLRITIQDDGIGISGKASSGYGLRNMQDRARLLDGRLEIQRAAPKGTVVSLQVPWSE